MTRAYRPLLEPLGLTYLQYLALMALWTKAPQSVGDLSRRLGLESSTLTPLFKRMEKAGLVTRTRDATDERRVMIGLTPHARALREKALAVPGAMFCQLPMPLEEITALKAGVERLIAGLRRADPDPA
ncbi:MAG: MarR family transcriptional regulator [Phenylobacterium sp.]|nr:MarR family transcriptional regulator [Phenylobacterium sp.]